jgi:hypothetical protein
MADNNWKSIGANAQNKTITVEGIADVDRAAKILGKELSLSLTGRMGNYSFSHTYGIKEFAIEWEVGIAAKSIYFRANPVRVNDSVDGTRVMFYIVSEDWKELMRAWGANKA